MIVAGDTLPLLGSRVGSMIVGRVYPIDVLERTRLRRRKEWLRICAPPPDPPACQISSEPQSVVTVHKYTTLEHRAHTPGKVSDCKRAHLRSKPLSRWPTIPAE